MTYALTLVKGMPQKREKTLSLLTKLKDDKEFKEKSGVEIRNLFISFGWPDIILLMKANNVELLKSSIVELRDIIAKSHRDNIETSTIICTTPDDINRSKI